MSLPSTARLLAASSFLMIASGLPMIAHAQQANGGWFVPKAAHPVPEAAPAPVQRQVVRRVPVADAPQEDEQPQGPQPQPVLPLPPIPNSPDLPHEAAPPAAVIGIISVQDVMAQSVAAQEVQRVVGARRDQLSQDFQHVQENLRAERDRLQAEAKSLTSEQFNQRARHLQDEAMRDQRDFRNRARIVQEAAQVSIDQIERELKVIIPQVAKAHGMNVVLHLEQIAMNDGGMDISDETAQHLNQVLPHVMIPGPDVDPEALAKSGKMPTTADAQTAQGPQTAQEPQPASVVRRH